MPRSDRSIALLLALAAIVLYVVSGLGHSTVWDYYAQLAEALLRGRWWLEDAPAYLNELLPCGDGRYCVAYVPLPALAVLPFLVAFRDGTAQTIASAVAGGLAAAPAFLALRRLAVPRNLAVATTVFATCGTTLWFTASDGRAWYIAHSVAVLLASLALLAALDGRPAWVVGALIGAAALARLPVGLAAPGLALLVSRRREEPLARVVVLGALGMAPLIALELTYDLLRWGVPFEVGYARLVRDDPFFRDGLLSLSYLPRHLYAIFMQAPDLVDGSPLFLRPSWIGVSLVLTSPAFGYAIAALVRLRASADWSALALAAALPLVPDVLHGTVGFAQFGYRFSLDAQPFLLPLVAIGAGWTTSGWRGLGWPFIAVIAYGVLANLYGVVAITWLGYVR